jgi:hypothetical protein
VSVVLSDGGREKKGKDVWAVGVADGDGEGFREKGERGKLGNGQYAGIVSMLLCDWFDEGVMLCVGEELEVETVLSAIRISQRKRCQRVPGRLRSPLKAETAVVSSEGRIQERY